MFLLLSFPLQAFLQQSFQKKPWFPLLQAQDVCLLCWPCNASSCLEESIKIDFLCTEKIRSGLSGLRSFATHSGCGAWSRHPGCFPQRADPIRGSVAWDGVDADCPTATMEQPGLAEEVYALLQTFPVNLA